MEPSVQARGAALGALPTWGVVIVVVALIAFALIVRGKRR